MNDVWLLLLFASVLVVSCIGLFYFSRKDLPFSTTAAYVIYVFNFLGAVLSGLGLFYEIYRYFYLTKQANKVHEWIKLCGQDSDCVSKVISICAATDGCVI